MIHILIGFPFLNRRTRREVIAPYLIFLKYENKYKINIKAEVHPKFLSHIIEDNLDKPLGFHKGFYLIPAPITFDEAPSVLDGYEGEQIMILNKTGDPIGKMCSRESFFRNIVIPETIVTPSGIVKEAFMMAGDTKSGGMLPRYEKMTFHQFSQHSNALVSSKDGFWDLNDNNWNYLSNMAAVCSPNMRNVIAQYGYAVYMEMFACIGILTNLGIPNTLRVEDEKFHFPSFFTRIFKSIEEEEDIMSYFLETVPLLCNYCTTNKPKCKNRSPHLPMYDTTSYASSGSPEIMR